MKTRLTRQNFHGVWPALILPWTDRDELDEARFVTEIRAYANCGVHGVYTGGTTGEFYAQDDATFRQVAEIACREGHDVGLPVQIGCTALSTRTLCQRIRWAIAAGAEGVQFARPFWLELSDLEVIDVVRAAADVAGQTGIVLYQTNRAKRKLSPELLSQLAAEIPMLLGVKDTGCSVAELKAILRTAPDFAIFGSEHDLVEKISAGGRGTFSSIAGLNARRIAELYELAASKKCGEAAPLQDDVRRYTFELLVPMVREGLWDSAVDRVQRIAGGVDVGLRVQPPYRSATPEHVKRLKVWCRQHAPSLLP
jgi:dihydrodipicolinate synthase/N-acetylneuraminate lyase